MASLYAQEELLVLPISAPAEVELPQKMELEKQLAEWLELYTELRAVPSPRMRPALDQQGKVMEGMLSPSERQWVGDFFQAKNMVCAALRRNGASWVLDLEYYNYPEDQLLLEQQLEAESLEELPELIDQMVLTLLQERLEPGLVALALQSSPGNAQVWQGNEFLGTTPVLLEAPQGGDIQNLELRLEGYEADYSWNPSQTGVEWQSVVLYPVTSPVEIPLVYAYSDRLHYEINLDQMEEQIPRYQSRQALTGKIKNISLWSSVGLSLASITVLSLEAMNHGAYEESSITAEAEDLRQRGDIYETLRWVTLGATALSGLTWGGAWYMDSYYQDRLSHTEERLERYETLGFQGVAP